MAAKIPMTAHAVGDPKNTGANTRETVPPRPSRATSRPRPKSLPGPPVTG